MSKQVDAYDLAKKIVKGIEDGMIDDIFNFDYEHGDVVEDESFDDVVHIIETIIEEELK